MPGLGLLCSSIVALDDRVLGVRWRSRRCRSSSVDAVARLGQRLGGARTRPTEAEARGCWHGGCTGRGQHRARTRSRSTRSGCWQLGGRVVVTADAGEVGQVSDFPLFFFVGMVATWQHWGGDGSDWWWWCLYVVIMNVGREQWWPWLGRSDEVGMGGRSSG